jgi:hypothetical protein
MALEKIRLGTNEDGTPHYLYRSDGPVVVTGPITGRVSTADGTEYDVSEAVIEVASVEHAGHVSHAIGRRHEAEGHPLHAAEDPFVHECGPGCPGKKG